MKLETFTGIEHIIESFFNGQKQQAKQQIKKFGIKKFIIEITYETDCEIMTNKLGNKLIRLATIT